MSPAVVAIGVLGGAGAVARFLLDSSVTRRAGRAFPFGTLAVNLSGAFPLGLLIGAGGAGDAYRLVGTGLLGAYTTFSTWMLESHRLAQDGRFGAAGLNLALSLVLGLGAVWLGRQLGSAL